MNDFSESTASTTSLSGLAVRLYWLIFGNILLALMAMLILLEQGSTFSLADAGYGAGVLLLIGARHLDVARFNGLTAEGEPATMAHFRRYATLLIAVAVVMWGAVHGISALMS
ncbi:MAG: hypothetical protein CVU56_27350 [Deltaproteobacteria bacterium HGW-Deltaproteobacteria-14]|jgi:hypothetical protein|nr:MAG: hypothetical protein CVU56_27350 [Deltaproteobacteria bacterium HGW-Deltaproteobacteria-14]